MTDLARLFLEDRCADHEISEMALARKNFESRKRKHIRRGIFPPKLPVQAFHFPARDERYVEAEGRLGMTGRKTSLLPKRRRR